MSRIASRCIVSENCTQFFNHKSSNNNNNNTIHNGKICNNNNNNSSNDSVASLGPFFFNNTSNNNTNRPAVCAAPPPQSPPLTHNMLLRSADVGSSKRSSDDDDDECAENYPGFLRNALPPMIESDMQSNSINAWGSCSATAAADEVEASACDASDDGEEADADEDYIPMDYEEELADCSNYVFSDGAYCPATSQHQAAVADGEGNDNDGDMSACVATGSVDNAWWAAQRLAAQRHRLMREKDWCAAMAQLTLLSPEDGLIALKVLVNEACRRDVARLRRAGSSKGTVAQAMRRWHRLAQTILSERCLTQPNALRLLCANVHSLGLFCDAVVVDGCGAPQPQPQGAASIVARDMSLAGQDAAKKERRERQEALISSLRRQKRLFTLPPLRAYEEEPPTPVVASMPTGAGYFRLSLPSALDVSMSSDDSDESIISPMKMCSSAEDSPPLCCSHRPFSTSTSSSQGDSGSYYYHSSSLYDDDWIGCDDSECVAEDWQALVWASEHGLLTLVLDETDRHWH